MFARSLKLSRSFSSNSQVFAKHWTLNSGHKIPCLGYGTYLSNNADELEASIITAIKCGYRHIDAAWVYNNEVPIGKAIKHCLDIGIVKREDLFITEKIFMQHYYKDTVRPTVNHLLELLQLDYVDLLLTHHGLPVDPKTGKLLRIPHSETWAAMEDCVDAGLVRSLGVSNYTVQKLWDICCYAKYQPTMLQVECHPYFQQKHVLKFCQENDIQMTAFAPLSAPHREANKNLGKVRIVLEEKVIMEIGKKHGVSAAQTIQAWHQARGVIAIPKSTIEKEIRENIASCNVNLSMEEVERINELDMETRLFDYTKWTDCWHEKVPYYWF